MSSSTLSSKGQVTIPVEVRRALHLSAGDRVLFIMRDDGVVEVQPKTVDVLDLVGILVPSDGRHLTIDQMNAAIANTVSVSFKKSVGR
jgi:antitoxin PrlF